MSTHFFLFGVLLTAVSTTLAPSIAVTTGEAVDKPTVTIAYPLRNTQVTGAKVPVVISYVAGKTRVVRLDLLIDNVVRYSENINPPEAQNTKTFNLDTTQFSDGPHTIGARVFDETGNAANASVDVYVSNTAQDTTPPIVAITNPKPNQTVTGKTSVDIIARDNVAIKWVMLFVDDKFKLMKNTPPFNWVWDTLATEKDNEGKEVPLYPNGPHQLQAKALDPSNNEGFSPIVQVFVYNPENDPSLGATGVASRSPIKTPEELSPFSPIVESTAASAPSSAPSTPQEFGSVLPPASGAGKAEAPKPGITEAGQEPGKFTQAPPASGTSPEKTAPAPERIVRVEVPTAPAVITTALPTVLPELQESRTKPTRTMLNTGVLSTGATLGIPGDKPRGLEAAPVGGVRPEVPAPPGVAREQERPAPKAAGDRGKAQPEIQEKVIIAAPDRRLANLRMTTDLQRERALYCTELPSGLVARSPIGSLLSPNMGVPDLVARTIAPRAPVLLTQQRVIGTEADIIRQLPKPSVARGIASFAQHGTVELPDAALRPVAVARQASTASVAMSLDMGSRGLRSSEVEALSGIVRHPGYMTTPLPTMPEDQFRKTIQASTKASAHQATGPEPQSLPAAKIAGATKATRPTPIMGQPESPQRSLPTQPHITRTTHEALEVLDVAGVAREMKLARVPIATRVSSESPEAEARIRPVTGVVATTRSLTEKVLSEATSATDAYAVRRQRPAAGIMLTGQPDIAERPAKAIAAGVSTSRRPICMTGEHFRSAPPLSGESRGGKITLAVVPMSKGILTEPEIPTRATPRMSTTRAQAADHALRGEPEKKAPRAAPSPAKPNHVAPPSLPRAHGEPTLTVKKPMTYLARARSAAETGAAERSPSVLTPVSSRPEYVTFQLEERRSPREPLKVHVRRTYLVRAGDTVNSIAREYGVKPLAVIRANKLDSDARIVPGQELVIPPGPVLVFLDAEPVKFDTPPSILSGIALAPFRPIFEKGGGLVHWLPKGKQVIARNDTQVVKLRIGSDVALINESEVKLDIAAFLRGGRTIVPIRFFREALGAEVEWDPETGKIEIRTK